MSQICGFGTAIQEPNGWKDVPVTTPFALRLRARWSDMDFNQHMSNAAFLGCAEQCRMEYLDANGWPMRQFQILQLGPVVLEDRLTYRKELRMLEEFSVDMAVSAATDDWRRMQVRNQFLRGSDGALCANVDSVVLWMDLAERKPVVPPDDLRALWQELPRTDDFAAW
jgi:acyl-CoA thioester hydrolase